MENNNPGYAIVVYGERKNVYAGKVEERDFDSHRPWVKLSNASQLICGSMAFLSSIAAVGPGREDIVGPKIPCLIAMDVDEILFCTPEAAALLQAEG